MAAYGLYSHIQSNKRRSIALLIGLFFLVYVMTFAGALAAYCAVKYDLREAVKFASAAGALVCTKFGAIEALPTEAEIVQLLQREDIEGFESPTAE